MEVESEYKVLMVHMKCDECNGGLMESVGNTALMTYPPKYPHKCNKCGCRENYTRIYPYQKICANRRSNTIRKCTIRRKENIRDDNRNDSELL